MELRIWPVIGSLQESRTRFNQLSAYQCGEFVDQMVSDGLKR
jgi:hypothetical protein